MNSDDVQLGNVRFNPTTRALTFKDGQTGQLRNKSKEVLRYLVGNPGRTVPKDEIIAAVWPDVTVADEGLVQCIADIRRVIGPEARSIIETVPREGYRIHIAAVQPPPRRSLALPVIALAAVAIAALAVWVIRPETAAPPEKVTQTRGTATPPGTKVTEAYLEVLKGRLAADKFNKDESLIAERHFRRAIELDPTYARAYAELGTLFTIRFENDWTVLPDVDKEKALYFANKAVELDPNLSQGHYALGRLQSIIANVDVAASHLERAMLLQPDNEDARAYFAIVRNFQGESARAIEILEPALAAHPNPPYWYHLGLGSALFNEGDNARAAAELDTCLTKSDNSPYCLRYRIAVYGAVGQVAEAQTAGQLYADMGFDLSVSGIMELMTFHVSEDFARIEDGLRKAGLPE